MKKTLFYHSLAFAAFAVLIATSAVPVFAQQPLELGPPDAIGTVDADANTLIRFAINGLIIVGVVASLIFLLWGGIRWILSGGDKGKVDAARSTIVASIVGLIIVILAWVIINTVLSILTGCGLNNFKLPSLSAPNQGREGCTP